MRLAGPVPIRALVGKAAKLLSPEALDLAEVLRLPMSIVGVCLNFGLVLVILLHKENCARRRTYALAGSAFLPVCDDVVHLGVGPWVLAGNHRIVV